jgi:hypothetical protein
MDSASRSVSVADRFPSPFPSQHTTPVGREELEFQLKMPNDRYAFLVDWLDPQVMLRLIKALDLFVLADNESFHYTSDRHNSCGNIFYSIMQVIKQWRWCDLNRFFDRLCTG